MAELLDYLFHFVLWSEHQRFRQTLNNAAVTRVKHTRYCKQNIKVVDIKYVDSLSVGWGISWTRNQLGKSTSWPKKSLQPVDTWISLLWSIFSLFRWIFQQNWRDFSYIESTSFQESRISIGSLLDINYCMIPGMHN